MGWWSPSCAPSRPGVPCPFFDRSLWGPSWRPPSDVLSRNNPQPHGQVPVPGTLWGSKGFAGRILAGIRPGPGGGRRLLLLVLAEDELGLRDDCGELAVAAGDARLQHHRGAPAMQRDADRMCRVALGHGGKEIGLAFDGRRAPADGKANGR